MALDLTPFRDKLPYATQLFGVYQTLLGWQARQAMRRVDENRRVMVGNIVLTAPVPAPDDGSPGPFHVDRLGLSPAASRRLTDALTEFVTRTTRMPSPSELGSLVTGAFPEEPPPSPTVRTLPSQPGGSVINRTLAARGLASRSLAATSTAAPTAADDDPPAVLQLLEGRMLRALARENATALLTTILGQRLPHLTASPFVDPLATFDPATQSAVLSPVGVVNLFREYFFDLGSFLGEPVAHVWLPPQSSLELYETHSRRTVEERTVESAIESRTQSEQATTEQDDISSMASLQNTQNMSLAVGVSAGFNVLGLVSGSASTNLGYQSSRAEAQQTARRHSRQQSEKIATDLRRSFKTTFRSTTEATDTASRRYVIENKTDKLVNYELRRKMRRVGVQLQHVGTRLCWQVYVQSPGDMLGIATLVHAAESYTPPSRPDPLVAPEPKTTELTIPFAYQPTRTHDVDPNANYLRGIHDPATDVAVIKWSQSVRAPLPANGYQLVDVRLKSVERLDPQRPAPMIGTPRVDITDAAAGTFTLYLDFVNFHEQTAIPLVMEAIWAPPQPGSTEYKAIVDAYKEETDRLARQERLAAHAAFVDAVRDRVKKAGEVQARPALDLREEERTLVYRELVRQLTDVQDDRALEVTRELVSGLFDLDSMLYFVAPDWWRPKSVHHVQVVAPDTLEDTPQQLTSADVVRWGGGSNRNPNRANYLITEDARPAPLGASLGWLLQLDGDARRNAFLNSPWLKVVLPIRAGREEGALNWLRKAGVEGVEGLGADYLGPEPELRGLSLEGALHRLAQDIAAETTPTAQLKSDMVYETGFRPLEGSFRPVEPFEVFDQWVEVVPTDQVAATDYAPSITP